jgi:hypothetical protein
MSSMPLSGSGSQAPFDSDPTQQSNWSFDFEYIPTLVGQSLTADQAAAAVQFTEEQQGTVTILGHCVVANADSVLLYHTLSGSPVRSYELVQVHNSNVFEFSFTSTISLSPTTILEIKQLAGSITWAAS